MAKLKDDLYINNNLVWHKGNGGASSGLDADLLDGKHLTELLTSVSRPTNTNNLSIVVGGVTKTIALGSNAFNSNSYLELTGGTVSGQTNFSDLRLSLINVTSDNYQDINDHPGRLLLKNVYSIPTATTGMLSTMGTILQINGMAGHDKTQLIFNGSNGAIQYRKSWYSNTTWTSLRTILDSDNSSVSGNTIKINGTSTTWVNTHRGIVDNLTSQNNKTESLSAHQGYLLANGSARDSTKLPLSGGTMTGNTVVSNYGIGNVGLYSASRYQNVFSMGAAYVPSADGTSLGSMYGIAWTHPNVGGQSKAGLSHQALFVEAGVTKTAIGTGIWTSGSVTADTIYADTVHANSFISMTTSGFMLRGAKATMYNAFGAQTGGGFSFIPNNGTLTADDVALAIAPSKNVGIGIMNPIYRLDVAGTGRYTGNLTVNGNITATKMFRSSDIRLKDNMCPIDTSKIDDIKLIEFNWKSDNKKDYGVRAQDLEVYYPELVNTDDTGMKSVNYESLYAIKIARLEERIKELEGKLWKN